MRVRELLACVFHNGIFTYDQYDSGFLRLGTIKTSDQNDFLMIILIDDNNIWLLTIALWRCSLIVTSAFKNDEPIDVVPWCAKCGTMTFSLSLSLSLSSNGSTNFH